MVAKDTEQDLVLAPQFYWRLFLQPKLKELLIRKHPHRKIELDNTAVVFTTRQKGFTLRFEGTDNASPNAGSRIQNQARFAVLILLWCATLDFIWWPTWLRQGGAICRQPRQPIQAYANLLWQKGSEIHCKFWEWYCSRSWCVLIVYWLLEIFLERRSGPLW